MSMMIRVLFVYVYNTCCGFLLCYCEQGVEF